MIRGCATGVPPQNPYFRRVYRAGVVDQKIRNTIAPMTTAMPSAFQNRGDGDAGLANFRRTGQPVSRLHLHQHH
jgi:hypothetical protein